MKKAFITGINGQDGSFLAELLLEKGYEIYGLIHSKESNISNINKIFNDIHINYGSITNSEILNNIIKKEHFDEVYHLAAQSSPSLSFQNPYETFNTNIIGTTIILESIKKNSKDTKTFITSSAEIFGNNPPIPQNENTKLNPISPYCVSKAACFFLGNLYRNNSNLYICNGIMYNHESFRRPEFYVSRKISSLVAKIKKNMIDRIELGNINIKRDWGYAKDYVEAMWLTLQQGKSDNYIICSNEIYSIKEMVDLAFNEIGIKLKWFNT